MCTGTSTQSDNTVANNDYFKRRVLGFRAEMEFEQAVKKSTNFKFLEGGMFLSPKLDGSREMKNYFLYITFDSLPPEEYRQIYDQISRWDEVKKMIYVQISLDDWGEEKFLVNTGNKKEETNILVPAYEHYDFDNESGFVKTNANDFSSILSIGRERKVNASRFKLRKREQFDYFEEYELDTLKKIYANRYFVDNKHPEDKEKWLYGWDTRRLLWYIYIQQKIGLNILYNIRQIDNRDDRNFVKWDSVFLSDFLRSVSWSNVRGGGGGEGTLTVPFEHFSDLKDALSRDA